METRRGEAVRRRRDAPTTLRGRPGGQHERRHGVVGDRRARCQRYGRRLRESACAQPWPHRGPADSKDRRRPPGAHAARSRTRHRDSTHDSPTMGMPFLPDRRGVPGGADRPARTATLFFTTLQPCELLPPDQAPVHPGGRRGRTPHDDPRPRQGVDNAPSAISVSTARLQTRRARPCFGRRLGVMRKKPTRTSADASGPAECTPARTLQPTNAISHKQRTRILNEGRARTLLRYAITGQEVGNHYPDPLTIPEIITMRGRRRVIFQTYHLCRHCHRIRPSRSAFLAWGRTWRTLEASLFGALFGPKSTYAASLWWYKRAIFGRNTSGDTSLVWANFVSELLSRSELRRT